jgi:hypothetical protein
MLNRFITVHQGPLCCTKGLLLRLNLFNDSRNPAHLDQIGVSKPHQHNWIIKTSTPKSTSGILTLVCSSFEAENIVLNSVSIAHMFLMASDLITHKNTWRLISSPSAEAFICSKEILATVPNETKRTEFDAWPSSQESASAFSNYIVLRVFL